MLKLKNTVVTYTDWCSNYLHQNVSLKNSYGKKYYWFFFFTEHGWLQNFKKMHFIYLILLNINLTLQASFKPWQWNLCIKLVQHTSATQGWRILSYIFILYTCFLKCDGFKIYHYSLLYLPSSSVSTLMGALRTPSPLSVLADTSIIYCVYFFSPK